jgi:hypothetical protein
MIALSVIMTIVMVICFAGNFLATIYCVAKRKAVLSMLFTFGAYMSYEMIGNFAICTVEFINRGL